eukprot:RCo041275
MSLAAGVYIWKKKSHATSLSINGTQVCSVRACFVEQMKKTFLGKEGNSYLLLTCFSTALVQGCASVTLLQGDLTPLATAMFRPPHCRPEVTLLLRRPSCFPTPAHRCRGNPSSDPSGLRRKHL